MKQANKNIVPGSIEDVDTGGGKFHIGDEITFVNGKQLPRALTPPPFAPEVFIGRDDDLDTINQKLSTRNFLLLVNGEGGMGKTTLASEYYLRQGDKYHHTAWVLSEGTLADSLLRMLPSSLGISFDRGASATQRLDQLIFALANLSAPCLLVIDNANELHDLENIYTHLRKLTHFHLLLTTRITEFASAETFHIAGLPETDALALFKKYYPAHRADDDHLFFAIRKAVNENTLVIELLAKTLRELNRLKPQYTLTNLLEDLRSRGLLHLTQSSKVQTSYRSQDGIMNKASSEEIIAAMYDLNTINQEAGAMLSIFAVLPPENIPYALLEQLLPSPDEDSKIILELAQKGWIDFNETDRSLKISPVIQQVVLSKNRGRLQHDCEGLIHNLIKKLSKDIIDSSRIAYDHAKIFEAYAESVIQILNEEVGAIGTLSGRVGNFLRSMGNLDKAISYLDKALNNYLKLFGKDSAEVATRYNNLGLAWQEKGDLGKAISYYDKALNIDLKLSAEESQSVAIGYNNLGTAWQAKGDLDKAISYLEKALNIDLKLSGEESQDVATDYNNLGSAWKNKGNLDKAINYYNDALNILKLSGEASPYVAKSYSNLGLAWQIKGDLDKAISYLEKALNIDLKLAGEESPDVSTRYNNLGTVWKDKGDLDKAISYMEKSLNIDLKLFGEENPNVSVRYNNLGSTWHDKGDLDKAISYMEKSLNIDLKLFGEESPDVAIRYNNLGTVWHDKGDLDKAISYLEKALNIDLKLFGEENPRVARDYNNLGMVWKAIGDLDKTIGYAEKSYHIFKKVYGESNPSTQTVKDNLDQLRNKK